jgi:hypothetical protein
MIKKYLFEKVALPIMRRAYRDSSFVKHYLNELGTDTSKVDKNVLDLLGLLGLQRHTGTSLYPSLSIFNRAARYKILSPLTFEDDEWGPEFETIGELIRQNKRLSNIFLYLRENMVVDIDAITWKVNGTKYNLKTKSFEYDNPQSTFSGICLIYDKDLDKITPVWSGNLVMNKKTFMGDNTVECNCMEIYDPDNKDSSFYFTLKSEIPQRFYKDYILTDSEKLKPQYIDKYMKEIEWCGKHLDILIEELL